MPQNNQKSKCPDLIEGYKNHLRTCGDHRLSFNAYCVQYNIRYQSAGQWMRRHGLSVTKLRLEVYSEMCADGVSVPRLKSTAASVVKLGSRKQKNEKKLSGVCITFTDGTIVNIRHALPLVLAKFIESYNQICDKRYVQSE